MDYGCYFTYSSPLVFSFVKVLEIRNIFFSQKSRLHPSIGLAYTCYKAKSQWTIDIIQLLLLLLLLSSLSPPAPSVCPLKVQSWLTKWISKTHSLLLSQDNPVFILGAKGLSWGWFSCQCLSPSPKCNHLNKFPQMRCKWKCSMGLPVNLLKRNRFFFFCCCCLVLFISSLECCHNGWCFNSHIGPWDSLMMDADAKDAGTIIE